MSLTQALQGWGKVACVCLNWPFWRRSIPDTAGSGIHTLHRRDTRYGRTFRRCTCHPHERPWRKTQRL